MSTQDNHAPDIVRTTITLPRHLDQAIRDLAEQNRRPLSWEIRRAIEAHTGAAPEPEEAAA